MWPWEVHQFRVGMAAGAVVGGVLLVLAWAVRRTGRRAPLALGGIPFVAAGLWTVDQSHPVPMEAVVGIVGLGAAAAIPDLVRVPAWTSTLVAAPFGWMLASNGVIGPPWVRGLVFATSVVGGALVATTDHEWRTAAIGLPMLAITMAGIYATTPDTRETLSLLGVLVFVGPLGWPLRLVRLGRFGAGASVGAVAWVTAFDGRGRLASVVGGLACFALLAALPLAGAIGRLRRPPGRATSRRGPSLTAVVGAILAAHIALALYASRIAGLRHDVRTAVVLSSLAMAVAAAIAAAIGLAGWADRHPHPME